jgi:hypothetical protein
MKHLKKHPVNDKAQFLSESQENSVLNSKLDEVYELVKEIIKSSDIEDFSEAEDILGDYTSSYLRDKLWSDDDLSDWMEKKEFGE